MPLFEYHCNTCKNSFEVLQLAGRDAKTDCPKCGAKDVVQKYSVFSAHGSTAHGSHADHSCDTCPHAAEGGCCPG